MSAGPDYTYEELDLIRAGICPPGRKLKRVQEKARRLGLRFPPKVPAWTDAEIECLRSNRYPLTRSRQASWNKAFKLGIEFHPLSRVSMKRQREVCASRRGEILEEVRRTGLIRATARKFGVSYATVSSMAKAAGVSFNASPKDRRGESVEWGGSTWSWCFRPDKGFGYWRETTGRRRVLSRVIYEQAHGPIPPGMIVAFANGDRFDLRVENLELYTFGDFMKKIYATPGYASAFLAGGALGRLHRKINETLDPSLKAAASKKMVETKKKKKEFPHASL